MKAQEEGDREVKQENLYSDYQDVQGAKIPMKMLINRDGKKYVEAENSDVKPMEKPDDNLFRSGNPIDRLQYLGQWCSGQSGRKIGPEMTQGDAMDIHESVHQILKQKESFADLFYVLFLEDYPEARHHFSNVNFRHQSALLTMALLVMERHHSHSYPATEMFLNYLGTKHDDRGIPP